MTEDELDLGMFDPVEAFQQTLLDLYQVVQVFSRDDTAITATEFLGAVMVASEQLRAICTTTLAALTNAVSHKIPDDAREHLRQQAELDDLMSSPEDKQQRMIQIMKQIASWSRRPR